MIKKKILEKNITQIYFSSYLAKINRVSFGVISDRMTNETKIKNLKILQKKDWRKILFCKIMIITTTIILITIIKFLKITRTFFAFFFLISVCKRRKLWQEREIISPIMIRTHLSQDIIKISSLILLTVSHTVLVMLVWRIWYWINL